MPRYAGRKRHGPSDRRARGAATRGRLTSAVAYRGRPSRCDRPPHRRRATAPDPPRRVRGRTPRIEDRGPVDGGRAGRRHRRRAQPHDRRRRLGPTRRSAPASSTSPSPATAAANAARASASTAAARSPHSDTTTHLGIPITTPAPHHHRPRQHPPTPRARASARPSRPPRPDRLRRTQEQGRSHAPYKRCCPATALEPPSPAANSRTASSRSATPTTSHGPSSNTIIEGEEVDFAWRKPRLIVEVDGYGYHRSPTALRERPRTRRHAHHRRLARHALHLDPGHDPAELGRRGRQGESRTARRSTCAFNSPVVSVRRQQPGLGRSMIEA